MHYDCMNIDSSFAPFKYLGSVFNLFDDLWEQGPDLGREGSVLEERVVVVVDPNLPQQEKRARHDVLPLCMHACHLA